MGFFRRVAFLTVTGISVFLATYAPTAHQAARPWHCVLLPRGENCPPEHPSIDSAPLDSSHAWQRVTDTLVESVRDGLIYGGQVAVMHRGKLVLDVAVGRDPVAKRNYTRDLQTIVFSNGKTVEAVGVGTLVSSGALRYDEKISTYWPEFAQNGKENTTVSEWLRHEGDLAWFDDESKVPIDWTLTPDGLDRLAKQLAASQHLHPGEKKRIYHSLMRGVVLSELVARADPQRRRLSRVLRDIARDHLGEDVLAGLTEEEYEAVKHNIALHVTPSFPSAITRALLGPIGLAKKFAKATLDFFKGALRTDTPFGRSLHFAIEFGDIFVSPQEFRPNQREGPMSEVTSGLLHANARTLAKFLNILTQDGRATPDGEQLISSETLAQLLHRCPKESLKLDLASSRWTIFTDGGLGVWGPDYWQYVCDLLGESDDECAPKTGDGALDFDMYGWNGMGGSILIFSPEHELVFSFVTSTFYTYDVQGDVGRRLLDATVRSFRELE